MEPKRADDVPREDVSAGRHVTMQSLVSRADGDASIALRRFTMAPGGGMPRHTNDVEHVQYVVAGRGRVWIGEDVRDVEAGMALFIPAGVPHAYETIGDDAFVFLCAIPIAR